MTKLSAFEEFAEQPNECGNTCAPETYYAQKAWNGALKAAQGRIALIFNSIESDCSDERLEQLIQSDLKDLIEE